LSRETPLPGYEIYVSAGVRIAVNTDIDVSFT
jgi:hypothetical protein